MRNNGEMSKSARRNQQLLADALAGLLKEKEFDRITVVELTQRANVSRAVFYNYYWDLPDLVDSLESDLIQQHCAWWDRMTHPVDDQNTEDRRREEALRLEEAYKRFDPILRLQSVEGDYYDRLAQKMLDRALSDESRIEYFGDRVMAELTLTMVTIGSVDQMKRNVAKGLPMSLVETHILTLEGMQKYINYRERVVGDRIHTQPEHNGK